MWRLFARGTGVYSSFIESRLCAAPFQINVVQTRLKSRNRQRQKAPKEEKVKAKWIKPGTVVEKKLSTDEIIPERYKHGKNPVDDVWIRYFYPRQSCDLKRAIISHQEMAQPDILDNMDGLIQLRMVLNWRTKKKTKFLRDLRGVALLPNLYDTGSTGKVIAFSKDPEDHKKSLEAGATYAGGLDLVEQIKREEIIRSDFDFLVTTIDFVQELIDIRMQIKDVFPQKSRGNVGKNVVNLVTKFAKGQHFLSEKTQFEDEGLLMVPFGKLNQTPEQLEENAMELIDVIKKQRPSGLDNLGPFIKKITVECPPLSHERFLLKPSIYNPERAREKEDQTRQEIDEESDDVAKESS